MNYFTGQKRDTINLPPPVWIGEKCSAKFLKKNYAERGNLFENSEAHVEVRKIQLIKDAAKVDGKS